MNEMVAVVWVGCVPVIIDHDVVALVFTDSAQMNLGTQTISQTKLYLNVPVMRMSQGQSYKNRMKRK